LKAYIQISILVLSFTLFNSVVKAQKPDALVYMVVDQKAQFPGGQIALEAQLEHSIEYPREALRKQTEGKVFIRFVILKTGEVTDAKVLKGIGDGCDEEAIEIIKRMPKWNPAKHQGEIVASYYTIPIEFKLNKINLAN